MAINNSSNIEIIKWSGVSEWAINPVRTKCSNIKLSTVTIEYVNCKDDFAIDTNENASKSGVNPGVNLAIMLDSISSLVVALITRASSKPCKVGFNKIKYIITPSKRNIRYRYFKI